MVERVQGPSFNIGTSETDAIGRGRACLRNVDALRDYFRLLNNTIETNGISDKPEIIYTVTRPVPQ